jgi:flagellar biosynthesis/type III secretory pathway M-ring protein FliF/YscJ
VPAFLRSWGPVVAMWVVIVSIWTVMWWMTRRDRRRAELQQQLREMEQAIYEETLPEDEREALRRVREQRAEIRREARRRLGLPEDEEP